MGPINVNAPAYNPIHAWPGSDAMTPGPEGGMSPGPDAGMSPGPDAGMAPGPDAGMAPGPDAGMAPPPSGQSPCLRWFTA